MRGQILFPLLVSCCAFLLVGAQQKRPRWPAVQPVNKVFEVSDPKKAVIRTFIHGAKGERLYLFVCRTGDDESVPDVIYTGDLECRLVPARWGENEETLLVEEHGLKAWFSRGRMLARELYCECGSYPEYGRVRHFRLRGMGVTIEFQDVVFESTRAGCPFPEAKLVSYKLRLTVEKDPSASRDIAESSGYLGPWRKGQDPPRSCKTVQEGTEWTGK